jgi:hypothetical protein
MARIGRLADMGRAAVLTAAVLATLASPAWGCSICRCGDPTFIALGKVGIAQTGWRFALDWDEIRKT